MSERRKQIVRKVFKKLDPHKTGKATMLDLQKMYSAKKHPLVVQGKTRRCDSRGKFLVIIPILFQEQCNFSMDIQSPKKML